MSMIINYMKEQKKPNYKKQYIHTHIIIMKTSRLVKLNINSFLLVIDTNAAIIFPGVLSSINNDDLKQRVQISNAHISIRTEGKI